MFSSPFQNDALRSRKSSSLDVVVCLRFLFHHEAPEGLLDEHARMLKPGGVLVCDTLRWTPRGLVPPLDKRLGGRVWAHRESRIRRALTERGLARSLGAGKGWDLSLDGI